MKSLTFRTGTLVERSQLAYEVPIAYWFRKHVKSFTFRIGIVVEASQLA